LNIYDYSALSSVLGLEQYEIGYRFFTSETYYSKPFAGWSQNKTLQWYKEYNQVKHNRETQFILANFKNALDSISAVFVFVIQLNAYMSEDERRMINSTGLHSVIKSYDGYTYLHDARWPISICARYRT
jgi:hypothetical protein